jgi:hypothetical protein
MKQITLPQYFMGRDKSFPAELTPEIDANAAIIVDRANQLLALIQADGIEIEDNPRTGTPVSSGWRPASVNKATAGAAPRSKHLLGLAVDIYDPEGEIDQWCLDHQEKLALVQVWLEDPSATKGWTHWQCVPPRSGKLVFLP